MLLREMEIPNFFGVIKFPRTVEFPKLVINDVLYNNVDDPRSRAAIKSLAFSSRVGSPAVMDTPPCHE